MCGIAGFRLEDGARPDLELRARLERAVESLHHRGPDDRGYFVGPRAGVGMSRLSIVGIDTGHQPLVSEDGRIVVVGNGEIYNAPSLRRELEAAGHRFSGDSDIEVVLHGFEEFGLSILERLNGMFALAILDSQDQSIRIARDRLGIKPLFYAEGALGVGFSSEVPALLAAFPEVESKLDRWALRDYLSLGYVATPRTIYSGIRRLPPGHWALIDERGVQVQAWWRLPELATHGSDTRPASDWADEVESLLRDSVRMRTLGDVPAGAFLSGGLDSGTLVAMLSEATSSPVPCFTIAIDDPDLNEVEDARRTAEHFGCEHHVEVLGDVDMDELVRIFTSFGEPFADVSLLPTQRVAALARKHVKFVLSGDGGDELFCGYSWLLREARWRRLPKPLLGAARMLSPVLMHGQRVRRADVVGKALRAVGDLSSPAHRSFLRRRSLCHPSLTEALLHPRLTEHWGALPPTSLERHVGNRRSSHSDDPFELLIDLDRRYYLSGDILEKVDRATMMHSLEARVPFLDHRVVELCAQIPSETHLGPLGRGKEVLRHVIERTLPAELLNRKKRGFGVPVDRWFRGPLVHDLRDRLFDRSFRQAEIIDPRVLDTVIREHTVGYANHGHLLWALLSLAVWQTETHANEPLPV